jgi:hypothetical protein
VIAKLSIGQRVACLLTLREWTFGPRLMGLATCTNCAARLEMTFNVSDIRVAPATRQGRSEEVVGMFPLSVADYEVRFRLPNSSDLAATADQGDIAAVRDHVLERCLLTVRHNGEETSINQLPASVVDALVERMAQADPQANVQLALICPACGHQWQANFDIASFFWSEINAWAPRILREVHILASIYGWREGDILALSPGRRQMYLEMVSG